MIDINKHKFLLVQLLKDIYSSVEISSCLGFKGGTALMLFHQLPRFSVDLDFNLIMKRDERNVYDKLRTIASKYGKIKDEAIKHYGLIIVLDYGEKERNLKIEVSNRDYSDKYEDKNYLGIPIRVMLLSYMLSHKLCALLDRSMLTNRDIFDCHFLLNKRVPIVKSVIEQRMGIDLNSYLSRCIDAISGVNEQRILSGLGDLMDTETKRFVKKSLKSETISLMRIYQEFPITT